jgi:hypothetical protein
LQASKDTSIELYCGSAAAPDAACAGRCVSFASASTCGSCTASCADAGGADADGGSCAAPGVCAWQAAVPPLTPDATCASVCTSAGGSCVSAQTTPLFAATPIAEPCSASPASIGGAIPVTASVIGIGCGCSSGESGKNQTGNCGAICASLEGSPPCENTQVYVAGVAGTLYDTCSAPYALGAGNLWDGLVEADLPVTESLVSPGGPVVCQCTGAAP